MKNAFKAFLNWLKKPQTLTGLALLIAGFLEIWSGVGEDMICTTFGAALPLLIHNPTAVEKIQSTLQAILSAKNKNKKPGT